MNTVHGEWAVDPCEPLAYIRTTSTYDICVSYELCGRDDAGGEVIGERGRERRSFDAEDSGKTSDARTVRVSVVGCIQRGG